MSEKRRDRRNRILHNGEIQMRDGRYRFKYTDRTGTVHYVYSWRLDKSDRTPDGKKKDLSLREKERQIQADMFDRIAVNGGNYTVLELVEKYIATKTGVRQSTKTGYQTVINFLKKDPMGKQRISEFCGLTISDLDMENRVIDINSQLQRTYDMEYVVEPTKTNAGTRKIPMTDGVFQCFQAILEDREAPAVEPMIGGKTGFLFLDKQGRPEVAMHWEHRFNHMVKRYNDIYKEQMPNITPHVCRHTYCSNMARAGMNPKTLQYLMGHSDISVTMNTYTHLGLDDAQQEMIRLQEQESARKEIEKMAGKEPEGLLIKLA